VKGSGRTAVEALHTHGRLSAESYHIPYSVRQYLPRTELSELRSSYAIISPSLANDIYTVQFLNNSVRLLVLYGSVSILFQILKDSRTYIYTHMHKWAARSLDVIQMYQFRRDLDI
jgi:hypothetical protein